METRRLRRLELGRVAVLERAASDRDDLPLRVFAGEKWGLYGVREP